MTSYSSSFQILYEKINNQQNISNDLGIEFNKWFRSVFDYGKVPLLNKSQDDPYNETDFTPLMKENSICCLTLLFDSTKSLLQLVKNSMEMKLSQQCFDSLVVCCITLGAQYHSADVPWGSSKAASMANNLLQLLLWPNESNVLALALLQGKASILQQQHSTNSSIYHLDSALKPIVQHLANNFNKEKWKMDPGNRQVYLWLMQHLSVSLNFRLYDQYNYYFV